MKKSKPKYHWKHLYMTAFKTKTMTKAVNSLKALSSVVEIRNVVDSLKNIYPNLSCKIEGILYPSSPEELSEEPATFFKPESLISELNWAFAYMRGHWTKLKWFARKKIEFEHNFMLGEYEQCEIILTNIKKELGVSLWYYDAKSLLFEYEGKRSENLQFISNVLETCQNNNNYIPSLIYNIYERSSRRLSPYKFDEDLNALYKKNKTDLHEDYYKYVLFRLNYFNQYSNLDLSLPIMFESLSSLVDRYLIIINVLKAGMSVNIEDHLLLSKAIYLFN